MTCAQCDRDVIATVVLVHRPRGGAPVEWHLCRGPGAQGDRDTQGQAPVSLQLRPNQLDLVERVRDAFRAGRKRVLAVAPTAFGKTACSAYMIRGAIELGNRCLFAAGRTELIDQTVTALQAAGVTSVRVIQADRDEGPADAMAIVGSVQTLTMPRWLGALPAIAFGVLDEAHHGSAATWSSLVMSQPGARWVGLTATPERADGKPLGDLFDELISGPSVRELTPQYLVPCRIWAGPAELKSGELAMAPLEAYARFAHGQRAAIFCRDRAHAAAELEAFVAAGIPSAIVIGNMAKRARRETLERWRSGEILVVTSVGVLTEGFDLPVLGTAILARRFNHAGQYLQVAGRILRTCPGKTSAQLIDLTGCAHEHGPVDLEREYSLEGRAISGPSRDSFGQCKACGSMFLYGPRLCPHCGAEIPTRPLPPPRVVGAELTELPAARPRSEYPVIRVAKWAEPCSVCGRAITKDSKYVWLTLARTARHQRCPLPSVMGASA